MVNTENSSAVVGRAKQRTPDRLTANFPNRARLTALLGGGEERDGIERLLTIIAVAVSVIALAVFGFTVYSAKWLLLPIVTAFVLSLLLAPAADFFRHWRIPEAARAAIVTVLAFLTVLAGVYFLTRPLTSFADRIPEIAEEARDKLTGVQEAVTAVQEASDEMDKLTGGEKQTSPDEPQPVIIARPSIPETLANSARLVAIQSIFITVLVYFFLAARSSFKRKALLARSTFAGRRHMAQVFRSIEKRVGEYILTMLIINIGLGVTTGLVMWGLGMPSPLVWGALAAILNFVPYIGPVSLVGLLLLSGIVNFDTPLAIAAPAGAYMLLNFIESNFVTPALVGVRLRLSPIIIVLTISFWTWIWGPLGAVISVPMLVVLKTVCDASDMLRPIGVIIGEIKPIDSRVMRACRLQTLAKT